MPNVLIRNVPPDDLDQIRSAAAGQGTTLQNYLRDAVRAQAAYLRRRAALVRTGERLRGQPDVPADERGRARRHRGRAHRACRPAERPASTVIVDSSLIIDAVADPEARGNAARDELAAQPGADGVFDTSC